MGRGRQKAKNTRAARELKYFSPDTDYSALEAELNQKEDDASNDLDRWADDDETDEYAASDDDRVVELDEDE
jgi:hypothetical protein